MDLRSKRVLVMGLGRFGGGVGVTRFLHSRGAAITITDIDPPEKLAKSLAQIADIPAILKLGGHDEADFTNTDLVVVSPAVNPHGNRYIDAAINARVPLTSEIRLLAANLPNRQRTLGVTGSAGKSTTTAMIGHILRKTLGEDRVHVGGNIGGSLLNSLHLIHPDHWVVLELSSFMLEGLREDRWSPHIALVTNFSPNHLDWHGSIDAYRLAKQAILDYQRDAEGDIALFGPGIHNQFINRVRDMRFFEMEDLGKNPPIPLLIPGGHNQMNATLALHAVEAAGISAADAVEALADFGGLPHRLQFVCDRAGVRYFNDSKATTPEAAILAMESFPAGAVHVILGGYDKQSDLGVMARTAARHCRAIYTIGKTGDTIAAAARSESLDASDIHGPSVGFKSCGGSGAAGGGLAEVIPCGTLDKALEQTATRLRRGDVVLLSTGCASWDQYENFEARGSAFVSAVLNVTGEGAPHPAPGIR